MKRVLVIILAILVLAFIAIQFVPVERSNPPEGAPLQADAQVTAVLQQSCYDCHSNQTVWPWYSYVAPVSWLVAKDVREGREQFSFSEWGGYPPEKQGEIRAKAFDEVSEGGMPLPIYLKMHPQARLSEAQKQLLHEWGTAQSAANGQGEAGHVEHEE